MGKKIAIPRIVVQTWKTHEVPDHWKTSPASVKEKMPKWKHVLLSDEDNRNFCQEHFPDFLPYFDRFPHNIQRADAIRYMWLYVNGGVYMDLDIEVKKPLDELFESDQDVFLVSSGNISSYLTNAFMASKPGCKLWLDVIEEMKRPVAWYRRLGKHFEVLNTTGSMMLSRVIKEGNYSYESLPRETIMPCTLCEVPCFKEGSHTKLLQGSSWDDGLDGYFLRFWFCHWRRAVFYIIILILIILMMIWYYKSRS